MRLTVFVAAGLIILSAGLSYGQEWSEYNNQKDFFSIDFPGQPTVKDIIYETEYNLKLPARVHSVEKGPSRYTVTVVDYNPIEKMEGERVKACKAAGGDGDLCNDHTRAELRGALTHGTWLLIQKSAKVTHLSMSNADRVEGNEIYFTNPDGTRTIGAVYMHENRLYVIEATVPPKSPPPALFYQSIGFLDNAGKRIRYDTPYSNGLPAPRRVR